MAVKKKKTMKASDGAMKMLFYCRTRRLFVKYLPVININHSKW